MTHALTKYLKNTRGHFFFTQNHNFERDKNCLSENSELHLQIMSLEQCTLSTKESVGSLSWWSKT